MDLKGRHLLKLLDFTPEEILYLVDHADELNGNGYGEKLYNMSSLLPLNYNEQIRNIFGDKQADIRYHAMGVNTGMERLVKMMKIGTLSSMLVNQNL